MNAKDYWKLKFDEYPTTSANKLALVMMEEYLQYKTQTINKFEPPKIVIATEGCKEYLTPGKEYNVIEAFISSDSQCSFEIEADNKQKIYCNQFVCGHLNCGNWIIKLN